MKSKGKHVMILGLSTSTFTLVHVVISLVGIASGLVVLCGLLTSNRLEGWTALFLATTVLTSVTGFFFPADRLLPSHIVGIISLVALLAVDEAVLDEVEGGAEELLPLLHAARPVAAASAAGVTGPAPAIALYRPSWSPR